ncbi:Hint domain-containing protein [Cognatiyoonia koreensis]|uniref:Hint domain-containing protein n=1 Tax=Cognatiyoonia koreensis TaxID=364200 RepID=A0A1I0N125_9RHOB|nr:Hint domain-containing protein [Cognatiyoonia koreensis]SEV94505.1 Hint domain-containing protein [Cognatiyoonia koreensis]
MKTMPPRAAGLAVKSFTSPVKVDRFASQDGRPQRTKPLMRKYEIAHLTSSSSEIVESTRLAPALPAFEDAFAALGRGAILQTKTGPVAVEDLLPGDQVMTSQNGFQTLLWKGAMTIIPGAQNTRREMGTMTRITADALGLGRPSPDLVLGPAARLLHKANGIRTLTGADAAFIPVRDFVDSAQIIELTPIAPVHVYQLGFENHELMKVNGVEIESLHPGPIHSLGLRHDMLSLLQAMFPHKAQLPDFGTMAYPRIRLRDLDLFDVA